jgi:uncharacterized protein with PQ loop repeat
MTFLYLIILINTFAYLMIIFKIIKNNHANGVSIQAFLSGVLAALITILTTNEINIIKIYSISLFFSLVVTLTIYYYHKKTNYETIENKKTLIIGFSGSILGIYGFNQSFKSFMKRNEYTNVSIFSYILFSSSYFLSWFFYAESIYTQFVMFLSFLTNFYVVIQTYVTNKKKERTLNEEVIYKNGFS